ncbi:MAG: prepilin-type N-terminal cleavage/methylation domain-containing protein [Desulfobacterales bacterium]
MIQKLRGEKGFTLIELMIVIAIIGILAAIAIPNFISYRDKAYCSYAEGDAQNLLAGISCYFAEPQNTTFANGIDNLVGATADTTCKVTLNGTGVTQNIGAIAEDAGVFTVTVTDGSKRCPRAKDATGATTKLYTTYMGTTTAPGWK